MSDRMEEIRRKWEEETRVDPSDTLFLLTELDRTRKELSEAREALTYPRFGTTADLLEAAAKALDEAVGADWDSLLSPHLRRAADKVRRYLEGT